VNRLLLDALAGNNTGRPPVWFMRQAGRFLPDYQALRKTHSLSTLFHTPHLAAHVTQLPLHTLGVDAAILFSDILVIAEVFGYTLDFPASGGIDLRPPLKEERRDVRQTLFYVRETIEQLTPVLSVPLIGFCGGPYTVAKYMQAVTPPMLEKIAHATIEYLEMQIEAGVSAIQIFDSWAGLLSPAEFTTLALPFLTTVVEAIRPRGIPLILFMRGASRYVKELVHLAPAAISFDMETPLAISRREVPHTIALQGNLAPELLLAPLPELEAATDALLTSMRGDQSFIFNLGHGVLPQTSVAHASAVVRCVKKIL
jgi:uroporphyrinogen decarboxylase